MEEEIKRLKALQLDNDRLKAYDKLRDHLFKYRGYTQRKCCVACGFPIGDDAPKCLECWKQFCGYEHICESSKMDTHVCKGETRHFCSNDCKNKNVCFCSTVICRGCSHSCTFCRKLACLKHIRKLHNDYACDKCVEELKK